MRLCIKPDRSRTVSLPDEHRVDIVVNGIQHTCSYQVAAVCQKFPYRFRTEYDGGIPVPVYPKQYRAKQGDKQLLYDKCPYTAAPVSVDDGDGRTCEYRYDIDTSQVGEGYMLGEPHLLNESEALKNDGDEQFAGNKGQGRYFKKIGDERSGKEENEIEKNADGEIEEEYRAVIGFCGFFFANKSRSESAVDQDARECDKERENAYFAVIFGCEEIGENNTRYEIKKLLPAFVDETPNKGVERSLFQGIGHNGEKIPPRSETGVEMIQGLFYTRTGGYVVLRRDDDKAAVGIFGR